MTKALTYTSYLIAAILVVFGFLTARTYSQLAIAMVLFSGLAYLTLIIFPRRASDTTITVRKIPMQAQPVVKAEEIEKVVEKEKVEVVDIDKRTFLKLVGAAGASFFLFSLLGEKVKSLIFGSSLTPTTSNTGTGSASQASPTDGYKVTEIDEGDTSFYGFTGKGGTWLIMKSDSETNFRYAKGNSDFPGNWAKRVDLRYDYYYNLF